MENCLVYFIILAHFHCASQRPNIRFLFVKENLKELKKQKNAYKIQYFWKNNFACNLVEWKVLVCEFIQFKKKLITKFYLSNKKERKRSEK